MVRAREPLHCQTRAPLQTKITPRLNVPTEKVNLKIVKREHKVDWCKNTCAAMVGFGISTGIEWKFPEDITKSY